MTDHGCPVCGAPSDGLLCSTDVLRLEQALGDVRSLVDDLDVAKSKQSKVPSSGGGKVKPRPVTADDEEGASLLKHERSPINWGAVTATDNLTNVLVTWARDVSGETWRPDRGRPVAVQAAWLLLGSMPEIRRHGACDEIVDEITDAVEQARRFIDRPADRVYVGPCWQDVLDEYGNTVICTEPLNARPGASEVRCKVCGFEHEIDARRTWLIGEASKAVVTAREAARYLINVGNLQVTETNIRNWVARRKVNLRPGLSTQRQFELGALLDYIAKRHADTQKKEVADLAHAV